MPVASEVPIGPQALVTKSGANSKEHLERVEAINSGSTFRFLVFLASRGVNGTESANETKFQTSRCDRKTDATRCRVIAVC